MSEIKINDIFSLVFLFFMATRAPFSLLFFLFLLIATGSQVVLIDIRHIAVNNRKITFNLLVQYDNGESIESIIFFIRICFNKRGQII